MKYLGEVMIVGNEHHIPSDWVGADYRKWYMEHFQIDVSKYYGMMKKAIKYEQQQVGI